MPITGWIEVSYEAICSRLNDVLLKPLCMNDLVNRTDWHYIGPKSGLRSEEFVRQGATHNKCIASCPLETTVSMCCPCVNMMWHKMKSTSTGKASWLMALKIVWFIASIFQTVEKVVACLTKSSHSKFPGSVTKNHPPNASMYALRVCLIGPLSHTDCFLQYA